MQIFFIIGIPILLSLGSFLFKRQSVFTVINACGYFTVLLESAILLKNAVFNNILISYFNFIYVDALSAFFIFVTSVVAFAAAVYSIGYINGDLKKALISERKSRLYYLLFNLFCLSMFLVPALNNLALLWVAIEMTTLISAFLVGFYNTKESV